MVGREEDGGWRHFIYVNRKCAVRLGSPAYGPRWAVRRPFLPLKLKSAVPDPPTADCRASSSAPSEASPVGGASSRDRRRRPHPRPRSHPHLHLHIHRHPRRPGACPGSPPMSALLPSFSATNGPRPSPEPASTDQQHCTLPRLPHTGARSRTQYHTQPCDALAARHGAMGLSEDPGQRASSFRPVHDPPSVTPSQSRVRAPPTPRALLVAARSSLCRPCEHPLRHPRGMLAAVARMHGLRCRTAMLLVTVPTSPSLCTSAL